MTNEAPIDPALDAIGWYCKNTPEPQPVKTKDPNDWGLYDMHGNVFELTWDVMEERDDEHDDIDDDPVVDPTGPGSGEHRVMKGGSYDSVADICRGAIRVKVLPAARILNTGFRIARTDKSGE